ncbi:MAG: type II toxin-antitoxin system HicB family antitoxin [Pseudomonadota bacterium]|nr:type II toxin-antitoxin system HicB family antitoxin [Pseudomonadota bacterium]
MEILIAIHKDENSVYGVSGPDVPGCFSWGDSVEDAMKNSREAIYSHVQAMLAEGIPVEIRQSRIEDLAAANGYVGAVWALVQVDVYKLDPKPERIKVSIPRFLLSRIDAYAASRHETRSGFLTRAALTVIAAESKATEPV